MASLEQKIAAQVLLERGKKLSKIESEGKSNKDLEAERLFFWILTMLSLTMEEANPPRRDYRLVIEEKRPGGTHGEIILSCGNGKEYHTRYVYGKDINDVIVRVKCTYNAIHGYGFNFVQPHNAKHKISIVVSVML